MLVFPGTSLAPDEPSHLHQNLCSRGADVLVDSVTRSLSSDVIGVLEIDVRAAASPHISFPDKCSL